MLTLIWINISKWQKNYIPNTLNVQHCPLVREVELNLAAFLFALGDTYFNTYGACLLVCVGLCKFEIWVNFKGTGSIFLFCKPVWHHFLILYTSSYLAQQNRCTYVGCGESHVDHSTTHSQVCVFASNAVTWSSEVENFFNSLWWSQ